MLQRIGGTHGTETGNGSTRRTSRIESSVTTFTEGPILQAPEASATGAAADFGLGGDVQPAGLPSALRGVRVTGGSMSVLGCSFGLHSTARATSPKGRRLDWTPGGLPLMHEPGPRDGTVSIRPWY
jgi:hypothetical protein